MNNFTAALQALNRVQYRVPWDSRLGASEVTDAIQRACEVGQAHAVAHSRIAARLTLTELRARRQPDGTVVGSVHRGVRGDRGYREASFVCPRSEPPRPPPPPPQTIWERLSDGE